MRYFSQRFDNLSLMILFDLSLMNLSVATRLLAISLPLLPCFAFAATHVYVSNAEDGNISSYALRPEGRLVPGPKVAAGPVVMPMVVSPDRRYLFAGLLSKPYTVLSYRINQRNGRLVKLGAAPLAAAYPYLSVDKSGRFLLGASYGGHQVGVNAIEGDGRISDPIRIIPTAQNAHAIVTDQSNRFAFVPHLGTDQIFQFSFDANNGKLVANSVGSVQLKRNTGPRHLVISADNRFVYLLNEFTGTVTVLSIDSASGQLNELESFSAMPAESRLVPGGSRDGGALANRTIEDEIWASDLHMTPDGKFLYAAERTSSSISTFAVNRADGRLRLIANTPTERQPRGFAIAPSGKFLVAAGEKSPTVSLYSIDSASGALVLLGRYPSGKGANWVQIVETNHRSGKAIRAR